MSAFAFSMAFLLTLNVVAGLLRIRWGATAADRMLAAQLFSTTGTAVLLLLAEAMSDPALRDVALVSALLAAVSTLVFVRLLGASSTQASSRFDEHY